MSEIVIQTSHLTKQYKKLFAVNDVSITVEKGAIVGLVGKNGAGKTTLIRMLTGLVKPTCGTFELLPGKQRLNTSVAAIVENPSVYGGMSAIDNLRAQCWLLNLPVDEEYLRKTLSLVGLGVTTQKVKNFSLGMRQRLAIAMTLVGKPELLIMDEPTNGLDPEGIHDIREVFVTLNREMGTTIIVSSHILSELSKFATEFIFMDKGRVLNHVRTNEIDLIDTKRLKLTVDDAAKAAQVLEQFGKVETNGNTVVLYGNTQPTQVLLALSEQGINVSNFVTLGNNLEDYFIDLISKSKSVEGNTEVRHD